MLYSVSQRSKPASVQNHIVGSEWFLALGSPQVFFGFSIGEASQPHINPRTMISPEDQRHSEGENQHDSQELFLHGDRPVPKQSHPDRRPKCGSSPSGDQPVTETKFADGGGCPTQLTRSTKTRSKPVLFGFFAASRETGLMVCLFARSTKQPRPNRSLFLTRNQASPTRPTRPNPAPTSSRANRLLLNETFGFRFSRRTVLLALPHRRGGRVVYCT